MSFVGVNEPLWKVVSDIVADEGLSLYDVEQVSSRSLRVYIERSVDSEVGAAPAKGQGGVTSQDCTGLCRRLMVFFAAEGPALGVSTEPEIEVSSPGINRHLRLEQHFRSALGERVKVVGSVENGDGQAHGMSVIGDLREVSPEGIKVIDDASGAERSFHLAQISRARVDFRF